MPFIGYIRVGKCVVNWESIIRRNPYLGEIKKALQESVQSNCSVWVWNMVANCSGEKKHCFRWYIWKIYEGWGLLVRNSCWWGRTKYKSCVIGEVCGIRWFHLAQFLLLWEPLSHLREGDLQYKKSSVLWLSTLFMTHLKSMAIPLWLLYCIMPKL